MEPAHEKKAKSYGAGAGQATLEQLYAAVVAENAAVGEVVEVLESLPIPAVGSKEETTLRSDLKRLLTHLWTPPVERSREVAEITQKCIARFESRFLGADTFVFGDFVHTSFVLGSGSEGIVHLGFQLSSGKCVAIKKIDKTMLLRSKLFEEALDKQFEFLSKTDHSSIVKLYHIEKMQSCWYVYMDFIDGGDLDTFLTKKDPKRPKEKMKMVLSEAKAKEVFKKLVVPVNYLRENNVVHRDLKPANFMLTRSGEVKLVDFATMRDNMDAGGMAESIKGTPAYMAPEIWSKGEYEGEKVDVWSMGVILYEMVCGQLPWLGKDIKAHLSSVRNHPLKIPPSLALSKELDELLRNMLKVKAPMRLSWAELMTHDWLVEDPMSSTAVGNFLEENVRRLELMVEKLQTRCNVLETAQDQKDMVIRELSKELQVLEDEQGAKRGSEQEVLQLQAELSQVQDRYEKAAVAARGLEQDLAAVQTRLEKTEKVAQEGEDQRAAELEAVTLEMEATKRREAALHEKVLMSTEQVVQLKRLMEEASEESEMRLTDMSAKYTDAHAQLTALNQGWNAMQDELDKTRKELSRAQATAVDAADSRAMLEEELARTQSKMETVNKGWNDMDKELTSARGVADAALVRVNELDAEKRALIDQRDSLQRMVDDVLGNLTKSGDGETRQQLEDLGKEVIRLNEVIQEKDKKILEQSNELASLDLVIKQGFHMLGEQ